MRILMIVGTLLAIGGQAGAQPERYELGHRLKAFEQAWEVQQEAKARQQALELVERVTPQFFAFQLGEAGKTLDQARHILSGHTPSPAEAFAESLQFLPSHRVIDASTRELSLVVKPFYKADPPGQWSLRIGEGDTATTHTGTLPLTVTVRLPELAAGQDAELRLPVAVVVDGQAMGKRIVAVSRIAKLQDRLTRMGKALKDWPSYDTLEQATLRDIHEMLSDLADGMVLESDVPAAAYFALAEKLIAGQKVFTRDDTRQSRISFPLGKKKTLPARIGIPPRWTPGQPVPVVFALHGAGGSENLFFEGYGAGRVVKECAERGWLVVTPRSGLGFGSGPPIPRMLDALEERYPIDRKRVFVVGHSMGAAQTIAVCQTHPGLIRGAAALGGGGQVRQRDAFQDLPVFVGVGSKDFALAGARSLARSLTAAKSQVTLKEYPDVEHMVIVREALPDVFAFFDTLAK